LCFTYLHVSLETWSLLYNFAVVLNEAKTSRPRPRAKLRGRVRGQDYEVEAEAKNNYEKVPNNDYQHMI